MKKIILSLVGFLGMTSIPLSAQSMNFVHPGETVPNSISFVGLPNSAFNGEYTLNTVESADPDWDGGGITFAANYNGPGDSVFTITTYPIGSPPPWSGTVLYFGGPGDLEIFLGENGDWSNNGWTATYDGGGFGPDYTPPIPNSLGAVIAQAEQLNIGLEFNDGRWTVAQPQ